MGPAQAPLPCSTGGPIANSALLAVFPQEEGEEGEEGEGGEGGEVQAHTHTRLRIDALRKYANVVVIAPAGITSTSQMAFQPLPAAGERGGGLFSPTSRGYFAGTLYVISNVRSGNTLVVVPARLETPAPLAPPTRRLN
jgi:hypothetical protein